MYLFVWILKDEALLAAADENKEDEADGRISKTMTVVAKSVGGQVFEKWKIFWDENKR